MISTLRHKKSANGPDLTYREYWRDERDRITAWRRGTESSQNGMEDGRGDRYQYDAEGQLTTASYRTHDPAGSAGDPVRNDIFSYDALGNRVRSNYLASRGWLDFTRKDNGLNQYSGWWNYCFIKYDDDLSDWGSPGHANGVLMQDGWITGSYNALNQPVSMWSPAFAGTSNSMWFAHDPLGRRVKRWVGPSGTSPTNPTYYYYDGWSLVQEGSSATNATRLYVHGARVDEIVAQITPGNSWRYFQYDARGHCTLQTDGSGDIVEQYDYDAFGFPYFYDRWGNNMPTSPWGNRFLFTGREWISDLRTYDYRNRMYQPELGRFLQPDPKQFAAGDYNLYRYCHNDPVNKNDPLGLDPMAAYFSNAVAPSETQAFLQRASLFQGATVIETPTGRSLVDALAATTGVERLAIHGHMWSEGGGGIRGTSAVSSGNSLTGVYGAPGGLIAAHNFSVGPGAVTLDALANAMVRTLAQNGSVNLFGCNSSGIAQSLSAKLANLGRGDLVISGAVGETNIRQRKDQDVGLRNRWNSFRAGTLIDSRRGVPFR